MIVLPRTTAEQRAPLYEDVETLVTVGFLSHSVLIEGKKISLRTLSPGDMFVIRARTFRGEDFDWQLWALAASVWMVEGFNLLEEQNSSWKLRKFVSGIPKPIRLILFSLLLGLFARQNRAFSAVEAWCCENQSRYKWQALKGVPVGMAAGIPGVEKLGVNPFQQMWRAFNEVEDLRRQDDNLWEGFKLAASASAPKGVRKIDQHDKTRKRAEEERRQALLDRFYYISKGMLSEEKATALGMGGDVPVLVSSTKDPDQLADEMHRWVTGQEDAHDQIVSAYKRKIVERYTAEKMEREKRRLAIQKKQQELEESEMPTRLVAVSAEQLALLLQNRKPGVRTIIDGDWRKDQDRIFNKHLAKDPDHGLLQESSDGKLIDPTGSSIGALQEQVASRQVPFHVDKR